MQQELYAFWKYDKYPFYAGGEIAEIIHTGQVEIKSDIGRLKMPVKIVPIKAGLDLQKQLNDLKVEFDNKQNLLLTEYNEKLDFMEKI